MENISGEIDKIVGLIKNGKIRIFCGAGISYNSGVPLVEPLVKRILEALGATEEEYETFKQAKYPFEAFMNAIGYNSKGQVESLVSEHLRKLFQIGSPNNNHYFISHLFKSGMIDKVVTTNFDCHIEKSLENKVLYNSFKDEKEFQNIQWDSSDNTLIKVHGCISDPNSIRTTLDGVANQFFHPEREKVIQNTFLTGSHEAVLVVGYSFSDHFDITPFLKKIGKSGKKLYIISHSFDEASVISISQMFPQISGFAGKVICGNTDLIIKTLWENTLDIPYEENINSVSKLFLNKWEEIIQKMEVLLSKEKDYKNYTLGDLFQAIHQTKIAKKYFQMIVQSSYSELYKGKAYIGLANVHRTEGNFEAILSPTEEALRIAVKLGDKQGIIACLTHLGIYYKRSGIYYQNLENPDKALELFDKALEHHNRAIDIINTTPYLNSFDELSDQNYHIGLVYFHKEELDTSFKSLSVAEVFADYTGKEDLKAQILSQKGLIFEVKGKIFYKFQFMPLALDYYCQALEKAKSLAISTLIIDCLIRIGNLGSIEERRGKLNEAEKIANDLGNEFYINRVKGHLDKLNEYYL